MSKFVFEKGKSQKVTLMKQISIYLAYEKSVLLNKREGIVISWNVPTLYSDVFRYICIRNQRKLQNNCMFPSRNGDCVTQAIGKPMKDTIYLRDKISTS